MVGDYLNVAGISTEVGSTNRVIEINLLLLQSLGKKLKM